VLIKAGLNQSGCNPYWSYGPGDYNAFAANVYSGQGDYNWLDL